MRRPLCSLAIVALLLVAACTRQAAPTAVAADNAAWAAFANQYIEDTFKARPFSAVQQGRHEFDGKMPDLSAAGIAAEIKRLEAAQAASAAFDGATLSPAQRFERDYLLAEIGSDLFWWSKAQKPFRNPAFYADQMDPEVYLSRQYAAPAVRLKGYIGYLQALPGLAADVRANLRTPLPKTFVSYGVSNFGGYVDFLKNDAIKVFAEVRDEQLKSQLATATDAAVKSMAELRDWFEAQRKSANDGFALGPELYATMLRDTEGVTAGIADIEAAGRRDLDQNTAALTAACAEFAPGAAVRDCVLKVKARKSKDGPVASARAELSTLKQFIVDRNIVSIPGTDDAEVAYSPPYNAQNSAYINIPGPYEKGVASVYNISPPDPKWTPAQRAAYVKGIAEVTNTTIHEVWPGHFLQYLHANRSKSMIGRLFVGYAYAEGWAHYSEQLMWDEGYSNGSAEMHIAQLLDALWRDCRLLSSIGLHTKGMTVAESEQLFRDRSFNDFGNARQQANRGTYDPAYLNYTLGKLMIMKLREDWVAKQVAARPGADPKSLWHDFHDRFLSYGGPPIPLVRADMLGSDNGPVL
jgi:uncharacterized protein (DUF885 family)